ncbi:hypothetical protein EJB05_54689 [Eragrostis curvula]|uniref:Uncharacterized protein n=1 Tax=Eragrostis curvula TaxID=38414 RepID=A0A5J9SLR3_9POAL|nr:hypothetical protein EJB05_54689 [Eragrostis curvula]
MLRSNLHVSMDAYAADLMYAAIGDEVCAEVVQRHHGRQKTASWDSDGSMLGVWKEQVSDEIGFKLLKGLHNSSPSMDACIRVFHIVVRFMNCLAYRSGFSFTFPFRLMQMISPKKDFTFEATELDGKPADNQATLGSPIPT